MAPVHTLEGAPERGVAQTLPLFLLPPPGVFFQAGVGMGAHLCRNPGVLLRGYPARDARSGFGFECATFPSAAQQTSYALARHAEPARGFTL